MKIIILGTGAVGVTLAENLVNEKVDITVVDRSYDALHELQEHYDIQTIQGVGSHPSILRRAGAEDCDLLIAVTESDELNMIACQVAFSLFRVPVRIARVQASAYLEDGRLFANNQLPIDVLINPETVVTDQISQLIRHPGATRVLDFADGKAQLIETVAQERGSLVGQPLRSLPRILSGANAHIAMIYRDGSPIAPEAETVIEPDDEVFFIVAAADIDSVLRGMREPEQPYRRIMIAGGGNIGERLAMNLEKRYSVKLIEPRKDRCDQLATSLQRTVVLCGTATDTDLMHEEHIEFVDIFCSVTNQDEANILSSLLAKKLGARKTMSLVNKTAYSSMFLDNTNNIDIVYSPRQTTVSMLLSHIRRGDVVFAHTLRRGTAEAIEAVVHGDKKSSKVVGLSAERLPLPEGATLCAVVRGDKVLLPCAEEIVIEPEDHMILFLVDKKCVHELERLFELTAVSF